MSKLIYQKKQDAMLGYYEKFISGSHLPEDEYVDKMMSAQAFIYSCRSVSEIKNLEGMSNRQIEIAASIHKDNIRNNGLIVSA